MTKINIQLFANDEENIIAVHNELERKFTEYVSAGYKTEDVFIEMRMTTFVKIINENNAKIADWLQRNAEILLKEKEHQEREAIRRQECLHSQQNKKKRCRRGYVYLIKADNGMYKIGKTQNLNRRIFEFGVKIPMRTELLHSFESDDYTAAEDALHRKYAEFRDHGEWFALTESCVSEICAIKDGEL